MAKPQPWPFEVERGNPTAIARRIAQAYREALNLADPALCQQIDEMARMYGQDWAVGDHVHDDDELVNIVEAGRILCVSGQTVRRHIQAGRLENRALPGNPVLVRVGDLRQLPTLSLGRPPRVSVTTCATV
ncbi:MAG TPA: hypothetical protein VIY48_17695 [Candidatus Paceibacterota bacterium]